MMLIDFHSHTLPLADHGCKNEETFLFQLAEAKKNGIGTVIATPHFYPHRDHVDEFLKRLDRGIEMTAGKCGGIDYIVGAEVQLCIGLDNMQGIEKLCIGESNIMLIEMPSMTISTEFYETLKRLEKRFRVVIAHVDRCEKNVTDKLIEYGFMLQLGADCFTLRNYFRIKRILKSGQVYALGSDIHGKSSRAYPRLVRAHKISVGVNTRMRRLIYGE